MLAAILALTLSALFNARALYKEAFTQPQGPARDVALAITGPLRDFSDAAGLTQFRAAAANVLGLGSKDSIVTDIGLTPRPAARGPAATVKRIAFSPRHKMRLYFGGDSLSETPGLAMEKLALTTKVIAPEPVDFHISSGLNRPDYFNWFKHLRDELKRKNPDVVVLMFGDNDADAFMTGVPPGTSIQSFGDAAWNREYRRRVGGMMDMAGSRPGRLVVWLGEPQMADQDLNQKVKVLNEVYRSEAAKRPGRVRFFDTYAMMSPNGGPYSDTLTVNGEQRLVREPDGEHITLDGGNVVAAAVLKLLGRKFDLTSWQHHSARQR